MKIKICGITRMQDAEACVEEGVDALGFIFVKSSSRYISPVQARSIIAELPPLVVPVGVFVNTSTQEILETADLAGIRVAQLHGEERPEDLAALSFPAYKGFRVGHDFDPSALRRYPGRMFLLDTFVEGRHGGTGRTFDWEIARRAKEFGKIMLGGGLTPDTVAQAISVVEPFGVDVSSGVETTPGIKDHARVKAFVRACRTIH